MLWLSSGNRRKTAPIPRDIIGFDAMSTVEARHTRLPGNQKRELDKLLGGSVCLFRPTDMNHRCQEDVESVSLDAQRLPVWIPQRREVTNEEVSRL